MSNEELMSGQDRRGIGSRANRRLALWLALIVPLLAYLLVFPVKARLDEGETERHYAWEIWRTMGNELPAVDFQWLFKVAFFAGGLAMVLGVLCMTWFALDTVPGNHPEQVILTKPDYDPLVDGSGLNPHS